LVRQSSAAVCCGSGEALQKAPSAKPGLTTVEEQEDHPIKELCEAVARGATYLHPLLLWVGGASFPSTLCKNGLFLCLMLLVYSIYAEGILKLY